MCASSIATTEAIADSLRGRVSIRPLLIRIVLPTVVASTVSVSRTRQCTGLEDARLFGTARLITIWSSTVVSNPPGVSGATRPASSRRSITLFSACVSQSRDACSGLTSCESSLLSTASSIFMLTFSLSRVGSFRL